FPMSSLRRSVFASLLLPVIVVSMAAQTLEHRPPPKPQEPAAGDAVESLAAQPVGSPVLPVGTNLQVEITRHYPMKANELIEGRLLHPIFIEGRLAVPQYTLLHGTVVALQPDSRTRWHGRLRGDFTPFHTAQVQFNELLLPGGPVALATGGAISGAPVVHLTARGVTPTQSFFSRSWSQAKGQLHDRMAYFTAPGFGDRVLQM